MNPGEAVPAGLSRGQRRVLAAVLLVGAALRVAAVLTVGDVGELHGDEHYYVEAGRALARGAGYPDSMRPPGFPFLVAAVFRGFGESLTAVRLSQVAVSLLAVCVVFDVGRRRFSPRAGLAAAAIAAVLPELVHYTHFLWSETLFTTLMLCALWALDRFEWSPRPGWAALAGVFLGLAGLTREMILPFAVVAAAWTAWVAGGAVRRRAVSALLLLLACAAVVLPWTARNYARHGQVVLVSTIRWFPVASGNLLPADGSWLGRDPEQQFATRYFSIPDELEREALARRVALDAIAKEQPQWIARKLVRNLYGLFTPYNQLERFLRAGWLEPRWQALVRALLPLEMALTLVVLALGFAGLWWVGAGRLHVLLAALVAFFLVLHVWANANHRFRLPLLPVLALFAGGLLATPATGWRRGRAARAGGAASAAALALIAAVYLSRGKDGPPAAETGPPPAPRRGIVLISIDTLRPDHLGCYGYARPTSPNLDAFAGQGVLFERAYAPSSWTLPSHTSMLSGLSPFSHGAVDANTRIADHVPLLADVLRAHGYQTFGAVGNPFVSEHFGFRRGFDRWLERRKSGRDPDEYQAEILRELRGLRPPFFAFLHHNAVHHPYAPPPRFNLFAPPGAEGSRGVRVGQLLHLIEKGAPGATPAEREMMIGLYDGEILAMDDRFRATLEELRSAYGEDLLIVVTSDHGEEFLEHGGLMHSRQLYDELLHVPLLLRGPGLPAGRRLGAMVSLLDVAPTVLDWAGVPAPQPLDGRSLLPLIRGEEARGTGLLPLHTRGHDKTVELWGLRSPNAKLIVDQRSGRREFYLLDEDPGERLNRHPHPRAVALERSLETLRMAVGASRPQLSPEELEALRALGYQ